MLLSHTSRYCRSPAPRVRLTIDVYLPRCEAHHTNEKKFLVSIHSRTGKSHAASTLSCRFDAITRTRSSYPRTVTLVVT
ncbi:Uncharacterised protein [Mycobacteroides abscessus subsp. abscessus]|nr:Uncharacterised protein [Mycobacteroides abscessus subsp. abscessus]